MKRLCGLIIMVSTFIGSVHAGLIGHYHIDETTGDLVSEVSPQYNLVKYQGAAFNTAGKSNGCIEMSQTNGIQQQYFAATDISYAAFTERFSISAWVYPHSYKYAMIWAKAYNTATAKRGFQLMLHEGYGSRFRIAMSSTNGDTWPIGTSFGPDNISLNEWHHVVVAWDKDIDNGNVYGYVDGQKYLIATLADAMFDNGIPLEFGRYNVKPTNSDYSWDGLMDEIQVYDNAITESEANGLYDEFVSAKFTMEAIASGDITDDNGNDNNGTVSGALITTGKDGNGLSFDGTDDYVTIANEGDFKTQQVAVSAWIKPAGISGIQQIIDMEHAGSNLGWSFELNAGKLRMRVADGTTLYDAEGTTTLSTDEWYHIVGVRSASAVKVYVNNIEEACVAFSGTINYSTNDLKLGCRANASSEYFNGIMDEVKIYGRELSVSEIYNLYNEFARTVNWYEVPGGIYYGEGNVGIGTSEPEQLLDIEGTDDAVLNSMEIVEDGLIALGITNESSTGYAGIEFCAGGTEKALLKYVDNATANVMKLGADGTDPFELRVDGNIIARQLTITQDGWADFVFDPSYKLASLKDVEQHIQQNKHLPEIPSAQDVAAQGVDVGEMQAKLLQKVEELTLYLIEQNKMLEAQGERIEKLEKENQALRNN